MKKLEVKLHEIATDGLPSKTDFPTGRVAFLWDGNIANGWPILPEERLIPPERFGGHPYLWEADCDPTSRNLARTNADSLLFAGVTHWLEFAEPLWVISPPQQYVLRPDSVPYTGGGEGLYLREVSAMRKRHVEGGAKENYLIHLYHPQQDQ